jgi:predicted membrane-bound spermidine synthase
MPSLLAGFLVFTTSAAVLVLEILAGRILAPYVGSTLQTYTGIIGTVLAGIALGTWLGGRMADRHDPRKLVGPQLVLGGVLALLILPVIALVGPPLAGRSVTAILVLSTAGFLLPAAVLSAVTPTVIKIQLTRLDETGQVVGRLSALGTAGAIVGTFITGFVLIAAFPTRPIIVGVGVLLVAGGVALWLWLGSVRGRTPAIPVAAAALAALLSAAAPIPCELESAYYCATVVPDPERESGRTLLLDALRHSYVDVDDPTHLEFPYVEVIAEVLAVHEPGDRPPRTVHIGGGGFTLPTYLAETRPGSDNVVIEVDPALVTLAREELALRGDPDVDVIVGDARLEITALDGFDAAVGDAFGGLAVPWHLTTTEFVSRVADSLTDGGVYAVNTIDYPPLGFARAHAATLDAVFAHTAVLAPPAQLTGDEGGNFVLVASDDDLRLEQVAAALDGWDVLAGPPLDRWVGDAPVLTDDYAPVDQLLTIR